MEELVRPAGWTSPRIRFCVRASMAAKAASTVPESAGAEIAPARGLGRPACKRLARRGPRSPGGSRACDRLRRRPASSTGPSRSGADGVDGDALGPRQLPPPPWWIDRAGVVGAVRQQNHEAAEATCRPSTRAPPGRGAHTARASASPTAVPSSIEADAQTAQLSLQPGGDRRRAAPACRRGRRTSRRRCGRSRRRAMKASTMGLMACSRLSRPAVCARSRLRASKSTGRWRARCRSPSGGRCLRSSIALRPRHGDDQQRQPGEQQPHGPARGGSGSRPAHCGAQRARPAPAGRAARAARPGRAARAASSSHRGSRRVKPPGDS